MSRSVHCKEMFNSQYRHVAIAINIFAIDPLVLLCSLCYRLRLHIVGLIRPILKKFVIYWFSYYFISSFSNNCVGEYLYNVFSKRCTRISIVSCLSVVCVLNMSFKVIKRYRLHLLYQYNIFTQAYWPRHRDSGISNESIYEYIELSWVKYRSF